MKAVLSHKLPRALGNNLNTSRAKKTTNSGPIVAGCQAPLLGNRRRKDIPIMKGIQGKRQQVDLPDIQDVG